MARQWSRRQHGDAAETRACQWLISNGLQLLARNWHSRLGEIDLIMQHDDTLVFVEVRLRRSNQYGGALASVTASKQHKLANTASLFLAAHPQHAGKPCRFDVLALDNSASPTWIQNAFYGEA